MLMIRSISIISWLIRTFAKESAEVLAGSNCLAEVKIDTVRHRYRFSLDCFGQTDHVVDRNPVKTLTSIRPMLQEPRYDSPCPLFVTNVYVEEMGREVSLK